MQLNVVYDFLPKAPTVRTSRVMDHFGIDFEQGPHVIASGLELPIEVAAASNQSGGPGQVILFTGASGSGKSSLMRTLASHLRASPTDAPDSPAVINIDDLELGDRPLIDALPIPVEQAMNLLASCGLGEAQLMLRSPQELSDGQRYRFRLALALSQQARWIVADEFTATLDRTLARIIAFNIQRLAQRTGTSFLLATTHEDVVADLAPQQHVQCRLDGEILINGRSVSSQPGTDADRIGDPASVTEIASRPCKKKGSHSPTSSGFPPRPVATGRISLGGITAATISE